MIRKCDETDFPAVLRIFGAARTFMAENGNPTQWGGAYPGLEELIGDHAASAAYVIERDGVIRGYCALYPGPEENYQIIQDGSWPDDLPYVTIHRLASDGAVRGVFAEVLDFCALLPFPRIRIDTHKNNAVMAGLLRRFDFCRCGIIFVADGTPRAAYIRENRKEKK